MRFLVHTLIVWDPQYSVIELASIGYTFCVFCLFIWLSLISKPRYKWFFLLLFTIAIVTQYGYWRAFNRFAVPLDFQTAIKSSLDLWYASASLFFSWVSIIPILIYAIFLWLVRDYQKNVIKIWLMLICLTISVDTVDYYLDFRHARNPGISVFSFFRTLYVTVLSEQAVANRDPIIFKTKQPPTNNIVLIIDESIRSDHLDINGYHRSTVPYLQLISNQGYLYNWGNAVSSGTCSLISNRLLLTGLPVTSDDYLLDDEYSGDIYRLRRLNKRVNDTIPLVDQAPTIFHYAKALGYQTHYIDAQTNYLWTGLAVSDLDQIDHWITTNELDDNFNSDFRAADYIYGAVSTSSGNFIILNKRGVHFKYENAYPANQAVWEPTPPNRNYNAHKELIANAYDNGIRYNVNTFFETLFTDLDAAIENTIYIYTSDHGETLFEDGTTTAHCGNKKIEAMIPIIMIGDLDQEIDTNYLASHSNIFTTILDLMDVQSPFDGIHIHIHCSRPQQMTRWIDSILMVVM